MVKRFPILKYCIAVSCLLCVCKIAVSQVDTAAIIMPPEVQAIPEPVTDTIFQKQFIIRKIIIEGNKHTHDAIILREMFFKEGDSITIKDFPEKFTLSRQQISNTTLFHEVNISVAQFFGNQVDIRVSVKERWYIFPFPHFKPVDRNLSEWLFKNKADFSRVDYGLKLMHNNLFGYNDKMRLFFITGYTRQLGLSYSLPYINKQMRWGANIDIQVGKNHEINDQTIDDKQHFIKTDDFVRNFTRVRLEFTYRKEYFTRHRMGLVYSNIRLADTVLKANPNYFRHGATQVKFPELYYTLQYQKMDYNPYPTEGIAAQVQLAKLGFNNKMNMWKLAGQAIKYTPINKKTFYSLMAAATIKAPFRQPYYSTGLIGYDNMQLRGYEYYVFDGDAGAIVNATLNKQLANFNLHIPYLKWFNPRLIPLKIYATAFADAGYVHNANPFYNGKKNRVLVSGGVGLDIFTFYDFTLKLQFAINQFGESGLFLHKKDMFN